MTVLEARPDRWLRLRRYTVTRNGAAAGAIEFGTTYQSADIALGALRFVAGPKARSEASFTSRTMDFA